MLLANQYRKSDFTDLRGLTMRNTRSNLCIDSLNKPLLLTAPVIAAAPPSYPITQHSLERFNRFILTFQAYLFTGFGKIEQMAIHKSRQAHPKIRFPFFSSSLGGLLLFMA